MAETFMPYVRRFVLPIAIDARITVVDRIIDVIAIALIVIVLIVIVLYV